VGRPDSNVETGSDFLAHYGVKGMKWGVIRDSVKSNPKGALRTARKAAGVVSDIKATKVRNLKDYHEYSKTNPDYQQAQEIRRKQRVVGVQTLSNRELQTVINRMNLEMQYRNLKQAEFGDTYVGMGTKFVGGVLRDAATDTVSSWVKRPGSNMSGRSSARASAYAHQIRTSLDGTVTQRRLGM
jgi:formylmethanofuran dehydrogenase subunit B